MSRILRNRWLWKVFGTHTSYNFDLSDRIADDQSRYATMKLGNPPQEIEVDLDMLASEFYIVTTTSRKGSRYDDFFSQTVGTCYACRMMINILIIFQLVKSLDRPYPLCFMSEDELYLPTTNTTIPISFPQCRPSKYSASTLGPSGSLLGLAPSHHLRQTGGIAPFKQLLDKEIIQRPIFSLMLINDKEGVLSIGGTTASAIERVVSQTEAALDSLADTEKEKVAAVPVDKTKIKGLVPLTKRGRHHHEIVSRQADWEEGWAWTGVQGAEGWWQTLMRGVWVDGSKVLKDQAVVIDVRNMFEPDSELPDLH